MLTKIIALRANGDIAEGDVLCVPTEYGTILISPEAKIVPCDNSSADWEDFLSGFEIRAFYFAEGEPPEVVSIALA